MDDLKLEGKTFLITGATGGIGYATAQRLHEAGAIVILSGSRNERLEELKKEFKQRVGTITCNLSDKEQSQVLVEKAIEFGWGLHGVVLNAGINKDMLALRMKIENWEDVINVNLTSSFIIIQKAIKAMMKQRFGRIIAISSVVASTGNAGQANYCASKSGLEGMCRSIAREVAPRGITVNCIAPGFITTPMTEKLSQQIKDRIKESIPMQRFGNSSEIASAIHYLLSDAASYITGHTLHVNGGMFMN